MYDDTACLQRVHLNRDRIGMLAVGRQQDVEHTLSGEARGQRGIRRVPEQELLRSCR
jgi:hypothetical protein